MYEKIIAERAEEEQCKARPLGHFNGLDSPVLNRLLADAAEDRPKKYGADLRKLHRYIHKGVHSPGAGMHLASLKTSHRREYVELKAEAQGQGELLYEVASLH